MTSTCPFNSPKMSPRKREKELTWLISRSHDSKLRFVESALKAALSVTGRRLESEYLGQGEFSVSGILDVEEIAPVLIDIFDGAYGPDSYPGPSRR